MELLERVGEVLSGVAGGVGRSVERGLTSLFGSSNARYVRRLQTKVDAINAAEPKYRAMTDAELKRQTADFRHRLAQGATLDDLLVEAFAVCREASRRYIGLRHYDVQLIGGMVLHRGAIAEMSTGEGKTLVATLPAYLNALEGKGVHVVTVNPYLARRDMEWMGPIYMGLGLSVGAIYPEMDPAERVRAYQCDITYGTNNEFGFDYLRDNMKPAARDDERYPVQARQVQGLLNFAIVDEVDNILIDEARTPLIISGPAHDDVTRYVKADRIARELKRDVHFEVKEKEHSAHLTDEGVRHAEKLAGVESFYTAGNMDWPHLIDNALKAHHLYKRDVNYVVQQGEVIIVDEFTGRLMVGRQWSDGLHQAVEAKEGVTVKKETQTYATVTIQNFFKLYRKISGMTGTAMTEAAEFWKIYKLDVVNIPTNKPVRRRDHPDVIFRSEKEKYEALANEIERVHKWDVVALKNREVVGEISEETADRITIRPQDSKQRETLDKREVAEVHRRGRPILVGTVSIEKSERLSELLNRRGVAHQVLNAKHHQREAEIIAQAGRKGAVTIATNMAGRGTDIILGGNPETMAWARLQDKYPTRLEVPREEWDALVAEIEQRERMKPEGEEVRGLGGLVVLGTERHEARRIDLQLRGRCGRQGDPGESRFFLSLEDDLMRIFAGEWVKNMLTRLGMQDGEAIESRMVTRRIEGAQKKVEERNFEIRKNLLEYDEVMDEQRKRVYRFRQDILDGVNCKSRILDMIEAQVDRFLNDFLDRDYGAATYAKWAGSRLGIELEARDFRGLDAREAEIRAKDEALRLSESHVLDALEENLPEDADQDEWNWEALAKLANSRWGLHLTDRELKKVGREQLSEFLLEKARLAIEAHDLSEGGHVLEPDFGLKSACAWVQHKFGIPLGVDEIRDRDRPAVRALVLGKTRAMYDQKELEYPVLAGLYHFTTRDGQGHKRYDREALVAWAGQRFGAHLNLDDLRNKDRDDVRQLLVEASRQANAEADRAVAEGRRRVAALAAQCDAAALANPNSPAGRAALEPLAQWLSEQVGRAIAPERLAEESVERLGNRVENLLEDRYRPEMRSMERSLVLQILDAAWKDHLLAMDHLRSSVGLRAVGQIDPKVEYRREGMRIYDRMWLSVGEQVTDLVFRIEQLDESFVGSTWAAGTASHESPPSVTEAGETDMQSAARQSEAGGKVEPIRNRAEHVGRNDPCPCGSGKKYKQCCMRKAGGVPIA